MFHVDHGVGNKLSVRLGDFRHHRKGSRVVQLAAKFLFEYSGSPMLARDEGASMADR